MNFLRLIILVSSIFALKSVAAESLCRSILNTRASFLLSRVLQETSTPERILYQNQDYYLYRKTATDSPYEAFYIHALLFLTQKLSLEPFATTSLFVQTPENKFIQYYRKSEDVYDDRDSPSQEYANGPTLQMAIDYLLNPGGRSKFEYHKDIKKKKARYLTRIDFDEKKLLSDSHLPPNFQAQDVPQILSLINQFPLQEILGLTKNFPLPEALRTAITRRLTKLRQSLQNSDGYFNHSSELLRKIKHEHKLQEKVIKFEKLQEIRELLNKRFIRDFVTNSTYSSFADFKTEVMSIPEYAKIVEEILNQGQLTIVLPNSTRAGVLALGIKNLFETQVSMFMNGDFLNNPYVEMRRSIEAEALGLTTNQYDQIVPFQYRPKSVFFSLKNPSTEQKPGYDYYTLKFSEVLHANQNGKLILTLSLGDSARGSTSWNGRMIPVEMFPYFAAPFVHQARVSRGNPNLMASPQFRKNLHGFTDVMPQFLNDMEKKLFIEITESTSLMDEFSPHRMVIDYIEAQIFGHLSSDLIESFRSDKPKPSPVFMETLKLMGIITN